MPMWPPLEQVDDGAPRYTAGSTKRSIDAATKDLSTPPINMESQGGVGPNEPVATPMPTKAQTPLGTENILPGEINAVVVGGSFEDPYAEFTSEPWVTP
jgi:hypothetical protein